MEFAIGIIVLVILILVYFTTRKKEVEPKIIYMPIEYSNVNFNELELVRLINEYRKSIRVRELKIERLACVLSEEHVNYMAKKDYPNHDYALERFKKSGTNCCGEIVQKCPKNSPQYVFQSYLESPSHKKTMSNPIYEWIGVSYKDNYTMCLLTKY